MAFFDRNNRYDVLGRDLYVLYDDNSWEKIYVAFPLGMDLDTVQAAMSWFRVQNITQKKMDRDEVYEYVRNFMIELDSKK